MFESAANANIQKKNKCELKVRKRTKYNRKIENHTAKVVDKANNEAFVHDTYF